MINITIPVFNEEEILHENILKIYNFLKEHISDPWFIVIANNGSTDKTELIAKELIKHNMGIRLLYIEKPGKGEAIKQGWQKFEADIYCFMDADLATDLKDLPNLISQVKNGYDIAIGSRYVKGAQVKRTIFRKIFSFVYRILVKLMFNSLIKDFPCGFKAINKKVLEKIVPKIKDNAWFFDSELLILAEKEKFKIKEIPVSWHDPERQSKVKVLNTARAYVRKLFELKRRLKEQLTTDY